MPQPDRTAYPEDLENAVDQCDSIGDILANLARARESLAEGEAMDGFHVEGPHISPEDGPRGAHPARWVRPPDLNEFRRWQEAARDHIRLARRRDCVVRRAAARDASAATSRMSWVQANVVVSVGP